MFDKVLFYKEMEQNASLDDVHPSHGQNYTIETLMDYSSTSLLTLIPYGQNPKL